MAASVAEVQRLRRWTAEPTVTTYSDAELAQIIERYPLVDSERREPDHDDWVATYDLHRAAAEVWEDKAAALAADFDFQADGASYSRSQRYDQAMAQARKHNSRAAAVGMPMLTTFEEATEWPVA